MVATSGNTTRKEQYAFVENYLLFDRNDEKLGESRRREGLRLLPPRKARVGAFSMAK